MKSVFNFTKVRKAIFFKPKHYGCIPHFMQTSKRDPFEYPLRPKD